MNTIATRSLPRLLHADGPASEIAGKADLYGWLVGDWKMDVIRHLLDGTTATGHGSAHFGWVLQGRVMQDIWRVPGFRDPGADDPAAALMHGTTLRIFDSKLDAWRIIYADPVRHVYSRQIGRAAGKDIVQEGVDEDGVQNRWRFTEITADSFHWIGEVRDAEGGDWRRIVEFFARRVA